MKTILIIEKERMIREDLEEGLKPFCKVVTIDGSKEIKAAFEKVKPDCVLSNFHYGSNETADKFFEFYKEESPKTIIIVMSGGLKNEDKTALSQGAHDFIHKPFGLQDLLAVFKKYDLIPATALPPDTPL